ncbi:hypothetical protein TNCT_464041 [Trichonephila clavata]|uniref:C2H2-type domain-containing protein n=1 Tax=Trichonephila clavata TaxID=2740835 RepID=A0A8X6LE14_TRICU|nr:hypothetical protein TNCT_464041 [Trichonephila clavata]
MAQRNLSPSERELFYNCLSCARARKETKIEFTFVSSEEPSFSFKKCRQSFQHGFQVKKINSNHTPCHRCEECNETFPSRRMLIYHSYGHSGDWPFRCLICLQGFATNSVLETA